jgi:hypothetical protein
MTLQSNYNEINPHEVHFPEDIRPSLTQGTAVIMTLMFKVTRREMVMLQCAGVLKIRESCRRYWQCRSNSVALTDVGIT